MRERERRREGKQIAAQPDTGHGKRSDAANKNTKTEHASTLRHVRVRGGRER